MNAKMFLRKNSSTILTVIGMTGVVVTAVATAHATVKASELLAQKRAENDEELSTKDKVKTLIPVYLPPIVIGVSTLACIAGSNMLTKRSQASLMSAYALVDQSYKDYQRKLKELYGKEAHEKIMDAVNVEKAEERYIYGSYMFGECNTYIDEPIPKTLFYEPYSDRFFESTIVDVMQAEYHLNRNYILSAEACLNEFYDLLGLQTTEFGSLAGWVPDDEGKFWIEFEHRKAKLPDGTVYYIIEMPFGPSTEYDADWNYPRY